MLVIQASYPDLGIWVLHLSVLHQQLAPNLEQILYSQWGIDPSQHSHWMDKPNLLNQFCYVWKANLGQKMSCEIVLFLFMARLWCIRFFLLMQAYEKRRHNEEMTAFFKCQRKRIHLKGLKLNTCFFSCGEETSFIFTCSFSWENQSGFLNQPWSSETLKQLLFIKEVFFLYCASFKTLWRLNPFLPHWEVSESEKILWQR